MPYAGPESRDPISPAAGVAARADLATGALTGALSDLASGQSGAAERVMPVVYAHLHTLAEAYLRQESPGHTLQPTALVNEAYLKLMAGAASAPRLESRAHFFAIAARAMRQILVDHARGRHRLKRGGGNEGKRIPLTDLESPVVAGLDLGDLDEALTRLAATDPVGARVTEMRFFGGMEMQDIATVLGTTDRTARRHWVFAKAWLCRELTDAGEGG